MNKHDEYLRDVRAVVKSAEHVLTPAECGEVEHLIAHGEPAEGLCSLAWIIVEEDKRVPAQVIVSIRELTDGLLDPSHLPPDLDSYVGD